MANPSWRGHFDAGADAMMRNGIPLDHQRDGFTLEQRQKIAEKVEACKTTQELITILEGSLSTAICTEHGNFTGTHVAKILKEIVLKKPPYLNTLQRLESIDSYIRGKMTVLILIDGLFAEADEVATLSDEKMYGGLKARMPFSITTKPEHVSEEDWGKFIENRDRKTAIRSQEDVDRTSWLLRIPKARDFDELIHILEKDVRGRRISMKFTASETGTYVAAYLRRKLSQTDFKQIVQNPNPFLQRITEESGLRTTISRLTEELTTIFLSANTERKRFILRYLQKFAETPSVETPNTKQIGTGAGATAQITSLTPIKSTAPIHTSINDKASDTFTTTKKPGDLSVRYGVDVLSNRSSTKEATLDEWSAWGTDTPAKTSGNTLATAYLSNRNFSGTNPVRFIPNGVQEVANRLQQSIGTINKRVAKTAREIMVAGLIEASKENVDLGGQGIITVGSGDTGKDTTLTTRQSGAGIINLKNGILQSHSMADKIISTATNSNMQNLNTESLFTPAELLTANSENEKLITQYNEETGGEQNIFTKEEPSQDLPDLDFSVDLKDKELIKNWRAGLGSQKVVVPRNFNSELSTVNSQSEDIEPVNENVYRTFIATGFVSKAILESIAEKVKNREKLTPAETAILKNKARNINRILEKKTMPQAPQQAAPQQAAPQQAAPQQAAPQQAAPQQAAPQQAAPQQAAPQQAAPQQAAPQQAAPQQAAPQQAAPQQAAPQQAAPQQAAPQQAAPRNFNAELSAVNSQILNLESVLESSKEVVVKLEARLVSLANQKEVLVAVITDTLTKEEREMTLKPTQDLITKIEKSITDAKALRAKQEKELATAQIQKQTLLAASTLANATSATANQNTVPTTQTKEVPALENLPRFENLNERDKKIVGTTNILALVTLLKSEEFKNAQYGRGTRVKTGEILALTIEQNILKGTKEKPIKVGHIVNPSFFIPDSIISAHVERILRNSGEWKEGLDAFGMRAFEKINATPRTPDQNANDAIAATGTTVDTQTNGTNGGQIRKKLADAQQEEQGQKKPGGFKGWWKGMMLALGLMVSPSAGIDQKQNADQTPGTNAPVATASANEAETNESTIDNRPLGSSAYVDQDNAVITVLKKPIPVEPVEQTASATNTIEENSPDQNIPSANSATPNALENSSDQNIPSANSATPNALENSSDQNIPSANSATPNALENSSDVAIPSSESIAQEEKILILRNGVVLSMTSSEARTAEYDLRNLDNLNRSALRNAESGVREAYFTTSASTLLPLIKKYAGDVNHPTQWWIQNINGQGSTLMPIAYGLNKYTNVPSLVNQLINLGEEPMSIDTDVLFELLQRQNEDIRALSEQAEKEVREGLGPEKSSTRAPSLDPIQSLEAQFANNREKLEAFRQVRDLADNVVEINKFGGLNKNAVWWDTLLTQPAKSVISIGQSRDFTTAYRSMPEYRNVRGFNTFTDANYGNASSYFNVVDVFHEKQIAPAINSLREKNISADERAMLTTENKTLGDLYTNVLYLANKYTVSINVDPNSFAKPAPKTT